MGDDEGQKAGLLYDLPHNRRVVAQVVQENIGLEEELHHSARIPELTQASISKRRVVISKALRKQQLAGLHRDYSALVVPISVCLQ